MLIYFSLSVKLLLLLTIFFASIILTNKKNLILFFIFFISFYIFVDDSYFYNLLNNIKIFFPQYYTITIERTIALFQFTDVSNYAIVDVNANIAARMESLKLFFNNPLFGIGLENERSTSINTQAHSGLISILIGTGIIGFLFFYFFIFYIFYMSLKYKYDDVKIISIIYIFYSLVNPTYSNPSAIIILFIASSLFILRRIKILT